jgi:hypothetical protein
VASQMIEQVRAAVRLATDSGHMTPMGARIIELVLDQHARPTPTTTVHVSVETIDSLPEGTRIGITRPDPSGRPSLDIYQREADGKWWDLYGYAEMDPGHLIHPTTVLWRPDVDVAAAQWHLGWEAGVSHVEGPLLGIYKDGEDHPELYPREELLSEIGDLLDFLGK